jgi:hypothetical protein
MTPQNLEHELTNIAKINNAGHIIMADECVNISIESLKCFCGILINNKIDTGWSAYVRTKMLDEEIVELMARSGCKFVSMGIESFNDSILTAMNKKATVEDHLKAIKLLKSYGIGTMGTFCLGFPGETEKTLENTVNLINESGLDVVELYGFTYFSDSPIAKHSKDFGLSGSTHYWSHKTMNSDDFYEKFFPEAVRNVNNLGMVEWDNWGAITILLSYGLEFSKIKELYSVRRKMIKYQEKNELDSTAINKSLSEIKTILNGTEIV